LSGENAIPYRTINTQVFAGSGRIVVAVNYHGSSGFGQRFIESITGRYGVKEMADVEAATDYLIARGYVDRTRLSATGGSYGGYMVAYMNGHLRRYRAYVCHAGCYDWVSMMATDGYRFFAAELNGFHWEKGSKIVASSPATYVGRARTPTLVIHGELELKDVEAATDWLRKQPWVDKGRIFATGGSYGGFMVAWMNGHVPAGRYAAYICHAGCFDWSAMFADDAYTWHAKELGAWYWDDMSQIHRQSPHAFAGAMETPTLVIHGALDYRVPDAQGLAYYNTLKARGIDARLLWFPDENHWVLKPRNSRLWYGEFFGWLKQHDTASPRKGRDRA
jgi:dipeptidyl aminopeptidase/acylaminoacyl peptidase